MAIIYPKHENLDESPYSEIKALELLKQLDDSFTVFHSVSWARMSKQHKRTTVWKENDFLILNKDLGLLVLEIKGGRVYFKDGVFHQVDITTEKEASKEELYAQEGRILSKERGNDPLTQARNGMYHFRSVIEERLGNKFIKRFPYECAAWFTHSDLTDEIEKFPEEYRDVSGAILDYNAFKKGPQAIIDVFSFYQSEKKADVTDEEYQQIIDSIASDFELVVVPEMIHGELEHAFIKLTNEQLSLLDYISEQKTATIQGVAGTGKTVIAKEAANRFAAEGSKVLYLCFNRLLCVDLLHKNPNPNIEFTNINTLISKLSGASTSSNEGRVRELLKIPYDYLEYDDVIIDEAQDFENEEIEYFQKFMDKKDGHFLVFYDKNQLVTTKKVPAWIADSECRLLLTRNCRNTHEIAVTSYNVIDVALNQKMKIVRGEKPYICFASDPINDLYELVQYYKKPENGYENRDIAILTLKTEEKSILSSVTDLNGIHISRELDTEDVFFTTARKFKGLEKKVVIVIDLDKNNFSSEEDKRIFYVACSRATQRLAMMIQDDEELISEISEGIKLGGRFAPKGKIAVKTKTNIFSMK